MLLDVLIGNASSMARGERKKRGKSHTMSITHGTKRKIKRKKKRKIMN